MKLIGFYAGRRTKKRRRNYRPLLVLTALALLAGGIGFAIHQLFKPDIIPDAGLKYIGDIPVYEDFLPEEAAGRVTEKREIKYLVIHETANTAAGADAEAHNRFIHENGMTEEHSWHYTVDDHQIYHHLPDDEPAYHAGDHMEQDGGNLNGIGIEMCVASDNDYDQTVANTAKLAAKLLVEYDLKPEVALRKHQDFSGKLCPQRMIEQGRWEGFAALVQREYDALLQSDT